MAKKTKTNVASGDDVVAMQIGTVHGQVKKNPDKPAKDQKPAAPAKDAKVKNVRSGDAQVGVQVDEIRGGISFGGRW